jgi:hypothetical protein
LSAARQTPGPDTPIVREDTGETLCGDCAIAMVASFAPAEDTGPQVEQFLASTLGEIALKTDVDQRLFSARCKTFVSSDIEIKRTARGYDVTFCTLLLSNPSQTKKVIDYAVEWIRNNPLGIEPLTTKRRGPQALSSGNTFIFMFIPASRPLPTDEDMEFMARQIDLSFSPNRVGWLVCSQPSDAPAENKTFIGDTLEGWLSEQEHRDSIMVQPRQVRTAAGRQLYCLVARRSGETAPIGR